MSAYDLAYIACTLEADYIIRQINFFHALVNAWRDMSKTFITQISKIDQQTSNSMVSQ
jgi:hypothetical protein